MRNGCSFAPVFLFFRVLRISKDIFHIHISYRFIPYRLRTIIPPAREKELRFQSAKQNKSVTWIRCLMTVVDKKILVVDDDKIMRRFMQHVFEAHGFTNVIYCQDGQSALDTVDRESPDCVLLDINLPIMDGFQVMRAIREDRQNIELPILVTSARTSHEDRNSMLRAGATLMLSKPLDPSILIARVWDVLERQTMVEELRDYQERTGKELALAKSMQEAILPSEEVVSGLAEKHGVSITGHHQMSSELGGDLWGVRDLGDNRVALFAIDFSGHGVGAALNTFRIHALLSSLQMDQNAPGEVLQMLNDQLVDILLDDQFATMFLAYADFSNDRLEFASAAAPPPVVGKMGSDEHTALDSRGLLLGIMEGVVYETQSIPFLKGQYLCLYSDALFETPRDDGRVIEMDDAPAMIASFSSGEAGDAIRALTSEFYHNVDLPLHDDLTLVYLERT